jgi:hypothetical protein
MTDCPRRESGRIRAIDESGEDYLYPKAAAMPASLMRTVRQHEMSPIRRALVITA